VCANVLIAVFTDAILLFIANWYAYIMRKILNLRKLALVAFFIAWLIWIIMVGFQVKKNLSGNVQVQVANLFAARHESTELPIYSKFYVTQSVAFSEPVILSRIDIPIRQPYGYTSDIFIVIQTDTEEKQESNFKISGDIQDLSVPLNFSKPARNMMILISAADVSWKVKDIAAPRVYREQSKKGYKDGQMTIVGINKDGNIALSAYASYSKINHMKNQFMGSPTILARWLRNLLFIFLISVGPIVFFWFLNTKHKKNGK